MSSASLQFPRRLISFSSRTHRDRYIEKHAEEMARYTVCAQEMAANRLPTLETEAKNLHLVVLGGQRHGLLGCLFNFALSSHR